MNQWLIWKTLQIKHTTQTMNAKNLASLNGHGSFACEIKYLAQIVYDRLGETTVHYLLKYVISQAKLLCPSSEARILRTSF